VSVDTLIDTCWPGLPHDAAMRALHSAVSRLRKNLRTALGLVSNQSPLVINDGSERYRLDSACCWVDHHTFYEALRRSRTTATSAGQIEALREVMTLYRGPLLEDVEKIDWLDELREQARRQALNAALTLADQLTDTDPAQVTLVLTAALAIDPADEPAARQLIALQLRLGQRASAERTYNTLVNDLTILDATPEPHTTQLLQQPSRQQPAPRPAPPDRLPHRPRLDPDRSPPPQDDRVTRRQTSPSPGQPQ
jgi:DNA-binding SARP family transcriptional activator